MGTMFRGRHENRQQPGELEYRNGHVLPEIESEFHELVRRRKVGAESATSLALGQAKERMMGAEPSPRNFRQVERGIEQALRNFTRGVGNGNRPPAITAHEPIDKIGKISALAIAEVGETTASEIEQAGQAAVEIAAEIMKEAQQLAADLRAGGRKMSERLQDFAMLAKKVSTAMRDTRAGVISPPAGTLKSDDLLPQLGWEKSHIPERKLFHDSANRAVPVWPHAEHIKLQRSLPDGGIFNMPPRPVERHQIDKTESLLRAWRFNGKMCSIPAGRRLRIELLAAARVHWTADEWATSHDDDTREIGSGIHLVDLATQNVPRGSHIRFTFYWRDIEKWEGMDFAVTVDASEGNDTTVAGETPN